MNQIQRLEISYARAFSLMRNESIFPLEIFLSVYMRNILKLRGVLFRTEEEVILEERGKLTGLHFPLGRLFLLHLIERNSHPDYTVFPSGDS